MKRRFYNSVICAALFAAGAFLVSCSEEEKAQHSIPGTFGEISVDRAKVGTHQWFIADGSYKPGTGTLSEELFYSLDDGLAVPMEAVDGKLAFTTYFTQAGKHSLKFSARNTGTFQDGISQDFEKTKEIEVVASDIRCHFWNDTREETLRNLDHYKTRKELADGSGLSVVEKDMYGDIDYSSEASQDYTIPTSYSSTLEAERQVYYRFDEEGRLNEIQYYCAPKDQKADQYVRNFQVRVRLLGKEYSFDPCVYNAAQVSLTVEEKAKVEACLAAINKGDTADDAGGAVGSLMANKGLMLLGTFRSSDGKTAGSMGTYCKDGAFSVLVDFKPAAR